MSDAVVTPAKSSDAPLSRLQLALRKPGFLIGAVILGISTLLALFPSFFAPYDPNFIDYLLWTNHARLHNPHYELRCI